ncbi:MAG: alpha/beta hydrolase [Chloroflexota bacterium]|nr:alpha/beta hydrolase [Chloroflexota bacterium]
MFALPVLLPLVWLIGLLALVVLGFGAFLVVGFLVGAVAGTAVLVTGIGLLMVAFLGRFLVLLSKRGSEDEPDEERTGSVERIRRPDGTELQVEVYGASAAPTLLLTHGWGSDSTQWYYLKRSLADHFRVVVWDVRGLGKSSEAPDGDYSLDRMADDLEAVLDFTGDPRTIVVGHSMGGMLILRLCRRIERLADKVSGLVLANTTHVNPVRTTAAGNLLAALERPVIVPLLHLTKWLFPVVWLMNWLSYMNGTMHLMLALTGFAGTESRGQLDRVATLGVRQHPGVLARQGLAMLELNELETLFSVRVPVLLLTADRDRVTVPQASEEIRRKTEATELVTLAPSGHMSVFEQHAAFSDAIRASATSETGAIAS